LPSKVGFSVPEVDVRFVEVEKRFMSAVIGLLQDISAYRPDIKDLDEIWESYRNQDLANSIVALDSNDSVLGFGTLLIEKKIRGGKLGHIEDIVVCADKRGTGLGKDIILQLEKIAIKAGCYKLVLNCSEHNVRFYEKTGLEVHGISMQKLL
jgi:glucosamine-phosphate N-acetyltransferase